MTDYEAYLLRWSSLRVDIDNLLATLSNIAKLVKELDDPSLSNRSSAAKDTKSYINSYVLTKDLRLCIVTCGGGNKMTVVETYLIPQAKRDSGVEDKHITITDDALNALIRSYCRESGVRNLQKQIEKIVRKAAFKVVRKEADFTEVSADNLSDLLGKPIFTHDRMYDTTPPGVVMGLAWTAMGGSALYIETVAG
ncbi:hypothetical protein AND_000248 [Anopheles darlingi]|uniref:Uncharacterized protein n=1 Tax=Anopheles darlingi TaxID=43151 RepID=W5JUB4_ANODA|nr:hypothetical protein AND_000248 [Anopheles darlingi]